MDHTEAVRNEAAERYLLGQLSDLEREEFEVHFFDCAKCAEELKTGAYFEENARAVFREDEARDALKRAAGEGTRGRSLWTRIWSPLTAPWGFAPVATLALLVVSAYQNLVQIPGLRDQLHFAMAPQAVASYVLPPVSRGDAQVREIPAGEMFYTVYMDPTWEGSFAAYVCTVQDDSGVTRFSVRLSAPPPGKPVQILMARSFLPSGRYTVFIRNAAEAGKPEAELARYALNLKLD
jgi:hypothetical protein